MPYLCPKAEAAQADADQADNVYAAAWNAGKTAGWPPAQQRAMGYPKPPARRPTPIGVVLAAVDNPPPPDDTTTGH